MPNIRDTGPSWYSDSWSYRYPISIDGVSGTSSGTVDISISIPSAWDEFWANITDTTNGYDIIVTDNDGITLLTFDYNGFSYANKTLTLEIDNYALTTSTRMHCLWVYWKKTSPSNLSTVFAPAAAISGYIELSRPVGEALVVARHVAPGATNPDQRVFKDPLETSFVWWDITDMFARRGATYNNGRGLEGIVHAQLSADPAVTASDAKTRYTMVDGRMYVRTQISGGASGTDANVTLTALTTQGRTLVYKVGVDIQTVAV